MMRCVSHHLRSRSLSLVRCCFICHPSISATNKIGARKDDTFNPKPLGIILLCALQLFCRAGGCRKLMRRVYHQLRGRSSSLVRCCFICHSPKIASYGASSAEVLPILMSMRADVSNCNAFGETLLNSAAANPKDSEGSIVKFLLEAHADPNFIGTPTTRGKIVMSLCRLIGPALN